MTASHERVPSVAARSIGARIPRGDDPRLLSGRGRYLADVPLSGALHAALVRSPIAHARIARYDIDAARDHDGVHLIWTGDDVAALCAGVACTLDVDGCFETTMPLLARGVVRYVGEPVALVIADDRYLAEDACDMIEVEYDPLPAVSDPRAAVAGGPLANEQLDTNVALHSSARYGDPEAAFASADTIVGATFHTGRLSATPMETRGCLADYDWSTGRLRVWTSTQMPHYIKTCLTSELGFPEHLCEVITPDTGGGFGQKAHIFPEELLVPLASRALGTPIKWVEDRRENLMAGTHAHEQYIDIAYAIDETGRITGIRTSALGDGGAYHQPPWSMAIEPWCATVVTPTGVYDIPSVELTYTGAATNKCPVGAYRGVGYMAGTLARECLMDEVAVALGLSPFEVRRRNVVRAFPWVNPQGITYDEGSWLETINEIESMVDYPQFLERQADARAEGRYLGLGLSVFVESSGESTNFGRSHRVGGVYHDTATVRVEPNGAATVTIGLTTQGQGHRTTMAQVASDVLGIPVEQIAVRAGESTNYAWGGGTVGSRSAVVAGGAVMRAADQLRQKLLLIAGELLEASIDDLELADGRITVRGSPDASVSVGEVASTIYFSRNAWPADFDPTLECTLAYDPARPMFSNGGHAMIVEVDADTGFVSIERVFSVEDCGTVINPDIVDGQIRGGVVQGIGAALLEELVYDAGGQLLTTTLLDYSLPTMDIAPPFEIRHLTTPSAHTPAGIKGMGESGLIAAPAAVLNAVNDAVRPFGRRLYDLPLTPERVFNVMRGTP